MTRPTIPREKKPLTPPTPEYVEARNRARAAKGRPALSAEEILDRREQKRARETVKEMLLNALDQLGGTAWMLQFGRGSPEDKRCLLNVAAKLIPLEVAGAIDTALVVKIVKSSGETVERRLLDGTPVEVAADG